MPLLLVSKNSGRHKKVSREGGVAASVCSRRRLRYPHRSDELFRRAKLHVPNPRRCRSRASHHGVFALVRSFYAMVLGDDYYIGSDFTAGFDMYSDIYCMKVRNGNIPMAWLS